MSKLKINKKRGEFEVLLNKKQIVIVPSLLNIAEWEEETGKHWLQYVQELSDLMSDRTKMADIFGAVRVRDLITFFRIFSKEELGETQIAEFIDEDELINVVLQYAIAIVKSISPKGGDAEEETTVKAKKTRTPTKRKKS